MLNKIKTKYKIITLFTLISSILTGLHFIIITLLIGATYYISLKKVIYAKRFKYFDNYLKQIGKQEINVYLIKSKYPNAFNIGKNIFFSTEFIRRFRNDKDILYATLGHEIGHYDEKHQIIIIITSLIYVGASTLLKESINIKLTIGYLITMLTLIWILEIKADLYSTKLSKENAIGLIKVLNQLKRFSLTHPPTWIRIKILEKYLKGEIKWKRKKIQ